MYEKMSVQELVQEYLKYPDEKNLNEIIKRLVYDKLDVMEYAAVSAIGNGTINVLIILKAPIEVVSKLFSDSDNCRKGYLQALENRLEKSYTLKNKLEKNNTLTEADKLIDNISWQVRKRAIKYASEEKLLERVYIEEDENVTSEILKRLKDYRFTVNEIEKIAYAPTWEAKFFAFKYAIEMPGFYYLELRNNLANKLLLAPQEEMKILAVQYASYENLIENMLSVNELLLDTYIERLKEYKFPKEKADRLMDSEKIAVIKLVAKYASKEKVADVLRKLSDKYAILDILESLE